ncbi:MAG: hypothetical protein MUF51_11790, partial [Vicinamibacteria bacterium]|nr:hypothetical protein [Vicinamibacteria bacterium]
MAEDNFALKQLYPYGFWQFLETDGWEGPYRLKTEPYYKALEAAAHADPDLLRNRTRQIRFTLGYVRARWRESALLVLDNVYRLYDRPANPYQWDYPFPARYQPAYQKAILLLALVGWMMSAAANRARALTVFVPLCFACVHGLTFPWPRYGFPALLTWIGLAGAGAGWIATAWPDLRRRLAQALRGPLALLVMSALLALAARALFLRVPEASRVASLCAVCGFIAGLFALVSALGNTVRHALLATAITMVVCTLVIAHTLRDPLWHT